MNQSKHNNLYIKTDNNEAELEIKSLAIIKSIKGVKNSHGNLYIFNGMNYSENNGNAEIIMNKSLEQYFSSDPEYIEISYMAGWGHEPAEISFQSGELEKNFMLYPVPGENSQRIFYSTLGFLPEKISINKNKGLFYFKGIEFKNDKNSDSAISRNIVSADLASILNIKYNEDEKDDFKVFSWELFPEILIFDFSDYEVQARYLKRLAFFTEKEGHVGKILDDSFLADKHGWNAHDYKPYDLAMFFQKASVEDFQLNYEEQVLKKILLENSVIISENGEYFPGHGALVSISRASPEYLRRQLLKHEYLHGIFFVDEDFRLSCFRIWDELPEIEKTFWMKYFDYLKYDIKNKYLVVNEFMAYHLQQNIESGEKYFSKSILPRFKRKYPASPEYIYAESNSPDFFIKNQASMNNALIKASGKDLSNIVYFYEITE